jgi:putative transposase
MPEHVHLLVSEPAVDVLSKAIQALKISVARRAANRRANPTIPLWQKRYYDHNVRTYESFAEKLNYIHQNPVRRGLAEIPEDWNWSSFRHYATASGVPDEPVVGSLGLEIGPVQIESQWTADRRNGETPRLLQIRSQ